MRVCSCTTILHVKDLLYSYMYCSYLHASGQCSCFLHCETLHLWTRGEVVYNRTVESILQVLRPWESQESATYRIWALTETYLYSWTSSVPTHSTCIRYIHFIRGSAMFWWHHNYVCCNCNMADCTTPLVVNSELLIYPSFKTQEGKSPRSKLKSGEA